MSGLISREDIVRRFEQFVDRALTSEEPPSGVDAEILTASGGAADQPGRDFDRRIDSYALWAAMTALSQEVKLEGRAFKELGGTLATQPTRIAEELRAVYDDREREVQRETERRTRRDVLGALIDLRDRLGRGLESARVSTAPPPGWWERLGAKLGLMRANAAAETTAALIKGYELGVDRLDQILDEFSACAIRCQGQPFDPRRMNAIDKQETSAVPEGTVMEVYRSGYEWNGEVFRPAQVKVACSPAAKEGS